MHKFVYGTYVDEVCVFIDRVEPLASTLGSEEFRYYHRNNQYSVVALTDDTSTGVILERYTYNSYGVPMRLDPDGTLHGAKWYYSDVGNQYLFTGRRWDSWLGGLYYYRARYYSPYLGRFISRDPIEYGDGPNMYAYVGSGPLTKVDPRGLQTGGKLTRPPGWKITKKTPIQWGTERGNSVYDIDNGERTLNHILTRGLG
ncbi:MAG: RHS repeat-associated core domain-containing protein [Planctomycetota bacterium]|nr:MAG: RHS repeat-associated core domain-containing protein [Planctomycetota bacterium]